METKKEQIETCKYNWYQLFQLNLTLAIAWKAKNSVFVAASMPWSQLMVPRREI